LAHLDCRFGRFGAVVTDEPIEGTVVDDQPEQPSVAVAIPDKPRTLEVAPDADATQLVQRLDVIKTAMQTAMVEGVDYGKIPGVDKPTLLKPGAEKLSALFQFDSEPHTVSTWGPGDHLTVEAEVTLFHAPTGTRLGKGVGLCSTREKKYGKRKQERVCPNCGLPAVIKGKAEYGGGWLCWKKKDGCGAKFRDGDDRIEGQEAGEVENPDLPDSWNTVVKMAKKRAYIDAVLAVTGASAIFTQDVEDGGAGERPVVPVEPDPGPQPPQTQQPRQQSGEVASPNQLRYMESLRAKHQLGDDVWRALLGQHGVEPGGPLPKHVASRLIERLKAGGPFPDPARRSDVPAPDGFDVPADGPDALG
jgi:hypothetical protein